jgi:hypothetical protein
MPKAKNPEDFNYQDCIEDCYYSSKFCYEKPDGTTICPIDLKKCVDECNHQYSS